MRLRRLEITHLPGIRPGFTLEDTGPGINVVTGPNASGKSSLVRALRLLIDESATAPTGPLTLSAELEGDAGRWRVTRTGTQIVWQKDGRPVERPQLPRGNFLHCYWLAMDDLLDEGDTEHEIVERLRRELSGGFDLDVVRRNLFDIGPRHGQSQERAFQKARQGLQAVVREYEALDRKRERLPELDEKIQGGEAADAEARKVQLALELLDAQRERKATEARLKAFPAGMDKLVGDEKERLEELEGRQVRLTNERREAEESRTLAQRNVDATGLGETPPDSADLDARKQDLDDARECDTRLREFQSQLAEAKARESEAASSLGAPADQIPTLSPDTVDRAAQMAERLQQVNRRVHELEAAVDVEPSDRGLLAAYEAVIEELRRWLRQLEPSRSRNLAIGAVIASIFALLAAGAAWSADSVAGVVLALLSACGSGWSLWQLAGMRSTRSEAQRRVSEQPLEPPESWTTRTVGNRLRELEERLEKLHFQDEQARDAEAHRGELESAREELTTLEEEKRGLTEEIGFDCAKCGESVERFIRLAGTLDQARAKRAELENKIEQERSAIEERLLRIVELVEAHGERLDEDHRDIASVRAKLNSLEARVNQMHEALQELERAKGEINRLDRDIAEVEKSVEELYRHVALEPGERRELLELSERFEAYREERGKLQEAQIRERERRSGLEEGPELLGKVEDDDEVGLNEQLDKLQSQAGRVSALRDERSDLRAQLDQAGSDRRLERARLDYDHAWDALNEAHETAMYAEAGRFLINQVSEEHRLEHEPEVLSAARERFARYTGHAYELVMGDEGRIQARDRTLEELRGLDELSIGTRMQLLMAVRLGYVSVIERDAEPLPVFLDEALTTTDPERFDAIARNLKDAANDDGRQIFYLSAQPADVIRWERAIGESPHHLDLPAVRFGEAGRKPSEYAVAEPRPVPEPGDQSVEEYASCLGVPVINPRDGGGMLHIFHLLRDDLDSLYRLMNDWRISHLGPLQQLLQSEAVSRAIPNRDMRQRLNSRCQVAHTWTRLWQQGRGRLVDRNTLEQCDSVSERFIDAVSELAEQSGGDAKALIEALRNKGVNGFGRSKTDKLEEWLQEHGYIDPDEPLTPEQRERQTLLEAGESTSPDEIQLIVRWLEAGSRELG